MRCCSGIAEQGFAGDCLQPPLVPRSGFRQRLKPGVRLQSSEGGELNTTLVLSLRARTRARPPVVTTSRYVTKETDMKLIKGLPWVLWSLIFTLTSLPGLAADYPAPQEGSWVVRDFRFHTGEVMPELRLHYTTVGAPTGEPVLILHGTGGSAANFLNASFAGELFGEGQPLDAKKYFIILPDALGAGKSGKPSDGLRAKFPLYNYADMVAAQHRLVTEGLGIKHLRLVIGNSMGGMQTWMWGSAYPDFMDALVPMAAQPTAMSSRNWMMRRMITDAVRNDPDWNNGNYTTQPRA